MSDLALVVAMAVITYASRLVFLLRTGDPPGGLVGRFLDVFPLALFVALATLGLAAPDGDVEASIALVAAGGGVVGAAATKRSLVGVLLFGAAAWWVAKLVV